jgi:hypothetical protein
MPIIRAASPRIPKLRLLVLEPKSIELEGEVVILPADPEDVLVEVDSS